MKFNLKITSIVVVVAVIATIGVLLACNKREDNIVFNAKVDEVYSDWIKVSTTDNVGFTSAKVNYSIEIEEKMKNVKLVAGQSVQIEALPEGSQANPAEVTAVSVTPVFN